MSSKTPKEEMLEIIRERCGSEVTPLMEGNNTFKFTCKGCGKCCFNRTGSQSILLSPYDVFQILKHQRPTDLSALIRTCFECSQGSQSGLPLIYLANKQEEGRTLCNFLEKQGENYRCSIHECKPSACRMYPLGRAGNGDDLFMYFLQEDTCDTLPNNLRDTHTLDEWIPNREESEKAFFAFTDFAQELYKIIPAKKLLKLHEIIRPEFAQKIMEFFVIKLYFNYDSNKDFFTQFKANTKEIEDIFEKLVITFDSPHV